jgi:hypothetical protein
MATRVKHGLWLKHGYVSPDLLMYHHPMRFRTLDEAEEFLGEPPGRMGTGAKGRKFFCMKGDKRRYKNEHSANNANADVK